MKINLLDLRKDLMSKHVGSDYPIKKVVLMANHWKI